MHKELLNTVMRLGALETRTEDVKSDLARVEAKMDAILERLARMEAEQTYLRNSVKNEIMADIKSDLTRAQVYLELQRDNLLPK